MSTKKEKLLGRILDQILILYRQFDLKKCTDAQSKLFNLCVNEIENNPALVSGLNDDSAIRFFVHQMALEHVTGG